MKTAYDADLIACGWYHAGIRDYHLAYLRERRTARPDGRLVSVVLVADGRDDAVIVEENRRFGASETYVFRADGAWRRRVLKFLPLFALFVWRVARRTGLSRVFLTHEGLMFWMVPGAVLRRSLYVFAHDPAPHESAEGAVAATIRRRYFRWTYFRRPWRGVVVGSESNRRTLDEGGCLAPIVLSPFPAFDATLFEVDRRPPELAGLDRWILLFGRVDVYKGIDEWLAGPARALPEDVPIVVAGQVIDRRVLRHRDRALILDRFVATEEVGALFEGARALVCPYRSATHSGVVDLGLSFGLPVYVSDLPYFRERYAEAPGVRPLEALGENLATT